VGQESLGNAVINDSIDQTAIKVSLEWICPNFEFEVNILSNGIDEVFRNRHLIDSQIIEFIRIF